jgi:hypothetical protein
MIEARQRANQLPTQPELRAGPLYTSKPSPQPSLQRDVASSANRHATSLSVPFRP